LVDVKTGLLPARNINQEAQAILLDGEGGQVARASRPALALRKPFQHAHFDIRALVHALHPGQLPQQIKQRGAPELSPAGETLDHQQVGIPVDDQAGQPI
jgi:hypothetical protein